jgi:nucleoside-diphosphate-sugar epimerase
VRGDKDGYASDLTHNWPYYNTKEVAEKEARAAAMRSNTSLVILRPSSILGPGEASLKVAVCLVLLCIVLCARHVIRVWFVVVFQ